MIPKRKATGFEFPSKIHYFRQDVFYFAAHLADLLLAVFQELGVPGGTQVDIGVRF